MAQPQKPNSNNRSDPKTTLSLLKWTTTISAVSLTLAGWGLLARAEVVNAAQPAQAQISPASLALGAQTAVKQAAASGMTGSSTGSAAVAMAAIATKPAATATTAAKPATTSSTATASSTTSTATSSTTTKPGAVLPTATAQPTDIPTTAPTDTPTSVPTSAPTDTPAPAPTDTPAAQIKLDVVQWVNNQNGDPIAVVRDDSGVLWYVWGPDVQKIEQGQQPQYNPVPVNSSGRSRHS